MIPATYPFYVVANWKMNGSVESLEALTHSVLKTPLSSTTQVVLCPSFPYLGAIKKYINNTPVGLGGQDCSGNSQGAYTGDVSAEMLKDLGCQYVILGHSERRLYHHENNQLINKKVMQTLTSGLIPVLCIGETETELTTNLTEKVLEAQLYEGLPTELNAPMLIAYEPRWAIGTGRTPTPDQIQNIHAFIRKILQSRGNNFSTLPILYGGSVTASNSRELSKIPEVGGFLVGGASLKADEFKEIIVNNNSL